MADSISSDDHSEDPLDDLDDEIPIDEALLPEAQAERRVEILEIDLDKPLRCGLSRREIAQMRAAGMKKPSFVPWPEWLGPQRLTHRQIFLCYLAASGRSNNEIADLARMSPARVSLLLSSEACREQVQLIREVEFSGLGVPSHLDRLSPIAARAVEKLLVSEDTSDNLRFRVADKILDRKVGKPLHRVEVGGTLVSDLYRMMNDRMSDQQRGLPPGSTGRTSDPSSDNVLDAESRPLMSEDELLESVQNDAHDEWLRKKGF